MTRTVAEIVSGITPAVAGLSMRGPRAIVALAESTGVTIHRDRLAHSGELLLTATDGTSASLEDLATNIQGCAVGSCVLVLLTASVDESSPESVAEAIAGAGATFTEATATQHEQFPSAVLITRTGTPDETTIDAIAAALVARRGEPETGAAPTAPAAMDLEARARLDRVRAETARLRMQVREAQARAEKAERALARVEASTSLRVGRRLVEAAKSPKSSVTLPRDVWRMWRLRAQRRSGSAPKPSASTSTASATPRQQPPASGSHLLNPRAMAVAPLGQLAIVAVTSDATAAVLTAHCAVTRVLPHNAAAVMEMIDADLVLIDTDAAQAPSAWSHLGDPSAADRESALIELVDIAHAQGRPVVLVRSGDASRSASLHALAERCDLVLTSSSGIEAPAWNVGIDLASAWLPSGQRTGAVFIGHFDARWSAATRESIVSALRAADPAYIHDWATNVSIYASAWPDDLRARTAALLATGDVVTALDGRAVGLASPTKVARGLLHPTTAAMLAGALHVVSAADPNLDAFESVVAGFGSGESAADAMRAAISRGSVTPEQHRHVLRELFLHHATPVMLQRLVDHLGMTSRPLSGRDVAVATSLDETSAPRFVDLVLSQRLRPAEVILFNDRTPEALSALRSEGVRVHHIGSDASVDRLGDAIDSAFAISADDSEWRDWPDTHLLDVAIDLEVGFEGVSA